MSEPEPDCSKGSGVLHGTAAPLSSALRGALYAAIEAIYAVGNCGPDTSIHRNAPKPDTGRHPVATNHDAACAPSSSAPNPPLDAACERLADCLRYWESRIEARSLRGQNAVYHFHPPSNIQEFESWVMGRSMAAADSALITHLRRICPKLGFEVLPVVLKYTGTTCQYNAWVPFQQTNGHAGPGPAEQSGFWKPYQHVKHSPSVFQFKSFAGYTLAETANCHEGNVLDERNVAWERARRGLFFWQSHHEQQSFDEERRVRDANPKWYQNIITGTSENLGHYFAPAIIFMPFSTQLEFVNMAEQSQPVAHIWRYLLMQCNESVVPAAYFGAVRALCHFVWPASEDAPAETYILGMQVRARQEWIDAIDSGIMGDLIMVSLVFKDSQLCNCLIAHTQVEPSLDYTWVCQNASVYGYSAADVLYGLRRFLSQRNSFLQIASIVEKLPAYSETNYTAESVSELLRITLATLEPPLSASHGRVVVNFLKLFEDFETWSAIVKSAIASEPRGLHRHSQFVLGLLNRLLEVTKKNKLPVDEVTQFYQQYAELMHSSHTLWQVRRLVSNTTKDQNAEAKTARQVWCVAEPTEDLHDDQSEPLPTSHTVVAGLFRGLHRLGMHDQVTNLADHIVEHIAEIEPIHIAPLWLPLLMTLQDVANPEDPAFQRLFQAILERYEKAVFEDVSSRLEQDPDSIAPMAACCSHCKKLEPYFGLPNWKTLHLVHPRALVDHIETQLRKQEKPIKVVVYGKNESSLTMQLTKTSLINEKLRTVGELRRKEATRTIRQFDPDSLLPFLGDKGEIMWKLGNAEYQEALEDTPTRSLDPPSSNAARLSKSRSSSSSSGSVRFSETPRRQLQHPAIKNEVPSSMDTAPSKATPKFENDSGLGIVKAEPSSASGSTRRSAHKDTRGMIGASPKGEKTVPGSSQDPPKIGDSLTRNHLKPFGSIKREYPAKVGAASTERLGAALGVNRVPREMPAALSYSSKAATSSKKTESSTPSEETRANEPMSSSSRLRAGLSRRDPSPLLMTATGASDTPRLDTMLKPSARPTSPLNSPSGASGRSLGTGFRVRSSSSSPSPATGSTEPDYMPAVLGAGRARKRRTSSTWEAQSATGNAVGSGTSPGKQKVYGFARKKKPVLSSSVGQSGCPAIGAAGRASTMSRALATRSPNVRPLTTGIPASAGSKRKVDSDDAVIDLCGSSPPFGATKKKKGSPVFNPLDDDPFGED